MRCAQFLRVGPRRTRAGQDIERGFDWLSARYQAALRWGLGRRRVVLAGAGAIFLASLALMAVLRKEFVPPQDQSMFLVRMQTPVGSSIEFTDERFRQAEEVAMGRPEVRRYFGAIGGFGGGEINTGILFLTFKPPRERPVVAPDTHPLSQRELMAAFRARLNAIPDLKATIQDLSLSGFSAQRGFPIEFTVRVRMPASGPKPTAFTNTMATISSSILASL